MSNRSDRPPTWRSRIATILIPFVLAVAGSVFLTPPAQAWSPNCSGNQWVSEVYVTPFGGAANQFEISTVPTEKLRGAFWSLNSSDSVSNDIWHAVQNCVPGLYGSLADGIYQQIQCHVLGTASGSLHAGGDTFDFESWRPPTGWDVALYSQCNWGGWPYGVTGSPYRPDGQPVFTSSGGGGW